MQVFVDESGDTGFKFESGSSRNFTVTAVVFPDDEAASACRIAVAEVRRVLGWRPDFEFKFNKTEDRARVAFLTGISAQRFRYYAFALDKPRLFAGALRQKDRMYSKVVSWVFENAMPNLHQATVTFDKRGERSFYQTLEAYLRSAMANTSCPNAIRHTCAKGSHEDDLLQVADMVCGAVARSYSGKPDSHLFRSIILNHQAQTRWWP